MNQNNGCHSTGDYILSLQLHTYCIDFSDARVATNMRPSKLKDLKLQGKKQNKKQKKNKSKKQNKTKKKGLFGVSNIYKNIKPCSRYVLIQAFLLILYNALQHGKCDSMLPSKLCYLVFHRMKKHKKTQTIEKFPRKMTYITECKYIMTH